MRRHVARSHCAPEYTGRAVRTCERHLLDGFRPQHATAHLCAVRAAARAVPAGPRCLRHEPHSVVHVAQLGGAAGAWGIERQRHELNFVAHNAPALLLRRKVLVLHGPASLPPHLGCCCCCGGGMRVQSLSARRVLLLREQTTRCRTHRPHRLDSGGRQASNVYCCSVLDLTTLSNTTVHSDSTATEKRTDFWFETINIPSQFAGSDPASIALLLS